MRILLTGITGFAGPHLANLLYEKGYTIAGARSLLAGDEAKEDANISTMLIKQTIEELEEVLSTLNS